MTNKTNATWGGRFAEQTDEFVAAFTASVEFDKRLALEDIQGSLAHAQMLFEINILDQNEHTLIVQGLEKIKQEIENDEFVWQVALEDVHMNIERRLTDLIGLAGKKLHTARSRNDQVATDIRLYLRRELDEIRQLLARLSRNVVSLAEAEIETIMPGFTHLQVAQPISFAHHLLAWYEMLKRDDGRLADCRKRLNYSPLGSAALAGTTYPINRQRTADLLGFDAPCANSLDAVSDRDFAIEFCAAAAIMQMHLSRFAEELIVWNSAFFQFVELPDRFCTGSSIMPQKKNPDVAELVRGKAGRVYGHLFSLLTLMKSQALAYNKDNQEDKEPLFDTIDTIKACLRAFADMLPNLCANREKMRHAAQAGFSTATDLADYLVRRGVAFRDAHEIVGKAVKIALEQNKALDALTISEFQSLSDNIDEDVYQILTVEGSVAARNHFGGTAPEQVAQAIAIAKTELDARITDR